MWRKEGIMGNGGRRIMWRKEGIMGNVGRRIMWREKGNGIMEGGG